MYPAMTGLVVASLNQYEARYGLSVPSKVNDVYFRQPQRRRLGRGRGPDRAVRRVLHRVSRPVGSDVVIVVGGDSERALHPLAPSVAPVDRCGR